MTLADDLLAANRNYAAQFSASGLRLRPAKQLAVLTCMDSRYTAQGVLGLALGDAHVIRNAGGRVTDDVLRSLVISAAILGTRACIVIHHTDCGLYRTSNDQLAACVAAYAPSRPDFDFLPFNDLDASVREDVASLRVSPYLPPDYEVLGFVYDVHTGLLRPVEE